jgi:hypothetical protein
MPTTDKKTDIAEEVFDKEVKFFSLISDRHLLEEVPLERARKNIAIFMTALSKEAADAAGVKNVINEGRNAKHSYVQDFKRGESYDILIKDYAQLKGTFIGVVKIGGFRHLKFQAAKDVFFYYFSSYADGLCLFLEIL